MKILHFILGKANPNRANGVNQVVHGLTKYSINHGHKVRVVGISNNLKTTYEVIERDNYQVNVFKKFDAECFAYLKQIIKDVDIVHLHGVWNRYNNKLGTYLQQINKPYVCTIHSGFAEDRLKQSKYFTKLLYHYLLQKKLFDNAAGIQAITREEIGEISKYTTNENIFYVPNGIDLAEIKSTKDVLDVNDKITCGYLGRLTVEKNVVGLIEAISRLPQVYLDNFECKLMGPDKTSEAEKLKKLVKTLNLEKSVIFTGGVYGDKKDAILKSLDFYIHPAFSDVISLAVIEAMSLGLPALITRTSKVAYFYDSKAFFMMEPVVSDMTRSIIHMIDNKDKWASMGKAGLSLVKEELNWNKIVPNLIKEYQNCIDINN